jgi:hypothetical protein
MNHADRQQTGMAVRNPNLGRCKLKSIETPHPYCGKSFVAFCRLPSRRCS